MKKALGLCVLLVFLLGSQVLAHHSFASMFDANRFGTIRGVVTKITWLMPHPYVYLDVRDDRGQTANWLVEGSSNVRQLERTGWSSTTLKPGDTISVCGILGKPNVPMTGYPQGAVSDRAMIGRIVTLSDGRALSFGSPGGPSCP